MFPGLYLDQEGRIVLPCNLSSAVDSTGGNNSSVPVVLTASASSFGTPICAVVIDCRDTGVGNITLVATNVRLNETVAFQAQELCSQPGVFFGCVDTAYVAAGNPIPSSSSYSEPTIIGQFGDQFVISFNTISGLQSNRYGVYPTCGTGGTYPYEMVSSLLLQDAYNRTITKLSNLRNRLLIAQALLFNNAQGIPCEDIGQATDLSQTALEFFNFLECIGNRQVAELTFLNELARLAPVANGSPGYCSLPGNGTVTVTSTTI